MQLIRVIITLVLFSLVFYNVIESKNKNNSEIIYVSVNGLVCDFCSRSIEKMFEKKEVVSHILVNLENMLITIYLRDNQKLDNETIIELIKDSGYDVTEINRAQ